MADTSAPDSARNSPEAVLEELEKILASPAFSSTPRLSRFLRFVVEGALKPEPQSFKEYEIGLEVFGRGPEFDPRLDAVVRVEARQLRFKLADYYSRPGTGGEIRILLPKGGYSPKFERVRPPTVPGLPPPVVKPAEPRAAHPAHPALGRRVLSWAVAALVLTVVGLAVAVRISRPTDRSIAVLPFRNLSADPSNQYFSDGLTDEITAELTRVRGLRVIARSSAFQFRDGGADPAAVGKELHAATLLTGSVEKSAGRLRIIANLENAGDGSTVWSNVFERPASDWFAVQTEIASAIAAALRTSVAPADSARYVVRDPEAHDLYMKGRFEIEKGTLDSLARAEEYFQQAIGRDPRYAEAYAGWGTAKFNRGGATVNSKDNDWRGAEDLWRKALALNPALEEAHGGLSLIALQYHWDWDGALREAEAAESGGPSARAEMRFATVLTFRGRFSEAAEHLRRCEELDPFGTSNLLGRGGLWLLARRPDKAREQFQRILDRYPHNLQAILQMANVEVAEGKPDSALGRLGALPPGNPLAQGTEAAIRAHMGQREAALRLLEPFEQNWESQRLPMANLAAAHAELGSEPEMMKWLERSADRHEWQVLNMAVAPAFARFHSSPEFSALKRRIGL